MIKKIILTTVSLLFHFAAISLVIYLIWPIAQWYLDQSPSKGVDLYLSGSYVSQLISDFAFRFNGWNNFWFSGSPHALGYPSLYFYLMLPLAKAYGLIRGVQVFSVIAFLVFAAFSYLLYAELARNRIIAIILTLATIYSLDLYHAWVWAGGIPFWTTQAFYPIVIFLIVKFCRSKNEKWLYLAALASGLGIMGHPQGFLNIILPAAFLILFFWQTFEKGFQFKKRIGYLFKFGLAVFAVGLPVIVDIFSPLEILKGIYLKIFMATGLEYPQMTSGPTMSQAMIEATAAYMKGQFPRIWSDSAPILWYLLIISFGVLIFSVIFRKRRGQAILSFLPFAVIFGYVLGIAFLFSRGVDFYLSGWYKTFWLPLVAAGTLAAFCWGAAKEVFDERDLFRKKIFLGFRWVGVVIVNLLLVMTAYYLLLPQREALLPGLEELSINNSAYPEIIGAKTDTKGIQELKELLRPKFMTEDPRQYRLYVSDATVNIWWSALEEMPLTRGYTDPPLTPSQRSYLFWLDAVLGQGGEGNKSSLIEDWKVPEETVNKNLPFLLDWYATKYLEGNHASQSKSSIAANVLTEEFIQEEETVVTYGRLDHRGLPDEKWIDDGEQSLNFFKIREDLISPILMVTKAAPVLHIGTEDGYDTLNRILGEVNLGPRKIVLARGSKFIDEVSAQDLNNFEAIILYRYDYHDWNKAWRLMENFAKKGGKIFIDTGAEVKESDSSILPSNFPKELPAVFPISRTIREDLGQEWVVEKSEEKIAEGIDFSLFSPLIFDNKPWNISHPIDNSDLREGAEVILKQKGFPIVVERSLNKGKVIWSGYNLPYHTTRDHNPEEAKFIYNILSDLVNLDGGEVAAEAKWLSSRERTIKVDGGKGVLFKEQAYSGWEAALNGKKVKIYKVGPSYPGFMYVKLPKEQSGEVKFTFKGSLKAKFYHAVSLMAILFIIDYILGGKILLTLLRRLAPLTHGWVGKWWSKEEGY
ncbi:MAG: hypothetical protein Q8Q15_01440 [bacterium]|nr:hypothetical protein [bacterium]